MTKSLDTFDFPSLPALNKKLVLEWRAVSLSTAAKTCWHWVIPARGKTHIGLALGLAACQRGYRHASQQRRHWSMSCSKPEMNGACCDVKSSWPRQDLLIVDELGYVPLSKTGAELLFEVFSQRYEQGSTLVTSNLPFNEWTEVFGSERLTGALLDRLTHHVHILEMNGESFRLIQSKKKRAHSLG